MSGFSINYHDSESEWAAKEAGPISVELVRRHEDALMQPEQPYYRVRIGHDLTIFMNRARVEALGFALIAAERITEVNAAAANQKESSGTAQSAAE